MLYDLRSDPMFKISQAVRGSMFSTFYMLTNGMLLKNDARTMKKSNDWGTTFTNVP